MQIKNILHNKTLLNGSLFSIFSFFNQGIAFLLLILLANYIAPAEYGKLSIFNTIVQFLGYFIALSTQGYLSVSYFQKGKEYFKQDISSITFICLSCTIICFLLIILGESLLVKWTNLQVSFLWIAVIVSSLSIFSQLALDFFRIQDKVKTYGLLSCSFAVLNFFLSIYLVINKDLNWEGRVYAHFFCSFIFGIIGIIIFFQNKFYTLNITKNSLKTITLWGIPLIPHLASVWIKQGGDRFIINHFHSIEDVGVFSFALNLTSIIIMVGSAFNATNSVSIFKTLSLDITPEKKKEILNTQTSSIMRIYLVAAITIVLGASIGIHLLLPNYSSSIPFFLILSLQGLGQCFYFLFCNYFFYYHQNREIMYLTFTTSVLHLMLSILLTRYSLYITCCIYVLVQWIVVYLIYRKSKIIIKNKLSSF